MSPHGRVMFFLAAVFLTAGSVLVTMLGRPIPWGGPSAGMPWLLALGFGIATGGILTWLAGHFQGLSSRRFAGLVDKFARGELAAPDANAAVGGGGILGLALERMAAALSTRFADLSAERDRLGAIVSGMQEGVLFLDRGGRILLVNAALEQMLGIRGEVIGRLSALAIGRTDLEELLTRAWGVGSAASGEIDAPSDRRLLVRAAPVAGEPGGLLVVFMDVTEVRRLENLRRDFVANVSHELRTPVATIRSAAETLRGAARDDPEMAERLVGVLERNAERLGRLVDDLLDLSRIESRQHRLQAQPIDLGAIANHVLDLFQSAAAEKGMNLQGDFPGALPPALGDPGGVEQVLVNLLDNAVKYGVPGGWIAIRARTEGRMIAIAIADSGPGIEAHHLPRLFERFYRVDTGRSRELGGTGLGLAIVKHLVETMGGSVAVDSTIDKGTTFRFTLPCHRGTHQA